MYRDLKNWLYIIKTIKSEKAKSSNWTKYKLRNNWYGRIYTVLTLREEDMGEELIIQNFKAMEMMRPINEYLSSLDFNEIVYPSIEKIPDSRSYLIVYSPIIKNSTFVKLFLLVLFIFLILYLIYIFK